MLSVPALFNLIEDRRLALGLFSLGAVLEQGMEWSDFFNRCCRHYFHKNGKHLESGEVLMKVWFTHHTISLMVTPMNIYY